jgi:hypothetical protein
LKRSNRESLVRRLLVICALAVMVFAVIAVVQRKSSQAATGTSNLKLAAPLAAGCPLGASYTFCNAIVGQASAQSVFTVTNTSSAAVTNVAASFAAVTGQTANFSAADFAVASTTCGASLAPNATCTINIPFTPTANGLRQSALTVKDTQGDSVTLNLAGTGSNLALASPALPAGCTPNNAFTFCNVLPGGISAASQFTLASRNAATGITATLAAIPGLTSEFNALDFTENSTCGGALGALATCPINIEFTPTVASIGLRAAELNVTDAQGDVVTVFLAGEVSSAGNTTSNLTLTPSGTPLACAFGNPFGYCNTPIGGTSANQSFTLTNTSGSSVTGIKIPFPVIPTPPALPVSTDFTVANSSCSATLLAHASCAVSIAFTPTATGSRQGSVTVTDAQGDLAVINLTGYGDDFQLQLATGQPGEITILPGGTATFKGQVVSDGVFGAQGEQVSFGCPSNLPTLTTCAFTPCPVSVTPGTPVTFSIVFVTSSPTVTALPPKGGVCPGTLAATMVLPMSGGPGPLQQPYPSAATRSTWFSSHFVAGRLLSSVSSAAMLSELAALGILALIAVGFVAPTPRRTIYALGTVIVACAVLAGCHHAAAPVGGTPTGQTTMVIQGQALDSTGTPLNTSRPMPQIILDVENH